MDTDAVIARRPQVALHTNAPGSKHEKRWQDVQDILDAGIIVISTVNIQHLESLNDVVEGITGVRVSETVPDAVVDKADEIEVVDISPQALRSTMRHGNIYPPGQSEQALRSFFREGNLTALRELVLRRVADTVEEDLDEYMREHHLEGWQAAERVAVLLDHTQASEVAIRRAWRLANAFDGELYAVYPSPLAREQGMTRILTVAMDLNATVRELPGEHLERELSDLLRTENITHLMLVADRPRTVLGLRQTTLVEQVMQAYPHLNLHLISRVPDR